MSFKADDIIKSIFVDELGAAQESLTDRNLSYGDIPEWDSNTHLIMIASLEEKLGITIDDDSVIELTSLDEIWKFINRHAS